MVYGIAFAPLSANERLLELGFAGKSFLLFFFFCCFLDKREGNSEKKKRGQGTDGNG